MTGQLGNSQSQLGNIEFGTGTSDGAVDNEAAGNILNQTNTATLTNKSGVESLSSLNQIHHVVLNRVVGLAASNTLTQTHSNICVKTIGAHNTINWSELVSNTTGKYFNAALGIGQALAFNTVLNPPISSYFQLAQVVHVTKTLGVHASNTYSPSNSSSGISVESGDSTVVWMQTVGVTKATPALNNLGLSQSLVVNIVKTIRVASLWIPLPIVDKFFSHDGFASNAFGMSQHVKVWKVFNIALTSPLVQHQLTGSLIPESRTSTITWTGAATSKKIIHVTANSLYVPLHSVAFPSRRAFSLSNQLSYLNDHSIYVPIGGLGNTLIPNLVVTKIATLAAGAAPIYFQGTNGATFIAIPQSPKKVPPYCTLQVPELAITLPASEFNDSEAYAGMFTIRRSMNGRTVTYVHRLDTSKLKYEFVMGLPKMYELENYLINYNSRIHTLTNWKGELWYVFITNNPMELISKSRYTNDRGDSFDDREKVMVTLEFEGTRIN